METRELGDQVSDNHEFYSRYLDSGREDTPGIGDPERQRQR